MLAKEIEHLINRYRQQALTTCDQQRLFSDNNNVEVCFNANHQYPFDLTKYTPNPPYYEGRYQFKNIILPK